MLKMHSIKKDLNLVISEKKYPSALMSEVDQLWESEIQKRPYLFNGKILSVDSIEPHQITGHISEYKYFLAQQKKSELYDSLKIAPLAVSGLLECVDGFVFGKRGQHLTQDSGRWELVPSGGINPEGCLEHHSLQYLTQLFQELQEEIGLSQKDIHKITPLIAIEDTQTHVIDIGIKLNTSLSEKNLLALFNLHSKKEYKNLKIIPKTEIAFFLEKNDVIPVSKALLAYQ